jgi:hypothetical protein
MKGLFHDAIPEDTMTMIIMGKGPSAKEITHVNQSEIKIEDEIYHKPPRLEIATVNDAWQIVDKVDYAFMIDYYSIELFKKPEKKQTAVERIKRLVIPTYAQVYKEQQGVHVHNVVFPMHIDYSVFESEYKALVEGIPYYLFQIDGSPVGHYGIDSLAERPSGTAFAAVTFAIARGFRHFILIGFDPIKNTNEIYNNKFTDAVEMTDDISPMYSFMYLKLIEKILSCGCTYQKLT